MEEQDKEEGEGEESENENLRELILQQLGSLEPSETSDDDSYKVRLSCILEDDESESSGAGQKEVQKGKGGDRGEEGRRMRTSGGGGVGGGGSDRDFESESDEFAGENVQVTDLDDVTLCEREDSEGEGVGVGVGEWGKKEGFAIKKLKSSENVHKRGGVPVRRGEVSSDSSDLDISVTNSGEGGSSDVRVAGVSEEGEGEDEEEKTLNVGEMETSVEEEVAGEGAGEGAREKGAELEVVDNETLAPIFAKVSRTYLEKTMGNVKWEENEKIEKIFRELVEEEVKKRGEGGGGAGEHVSLQDVHIRGTSRNECNPPIPPETYLWEELKRLRERGGYPWTYLDKPPFDEATWKKYMEHVYEPINPPPQPAAERKPETPVESTPEVRQMLGSSIPEGEQLSRIPSKASLSKKDSKEESKTPEEAPSEGALAFQERLESRFLAPTPSATSETTASQSKTDITSTVLDTSDFEEAPARPGTLVKTKREQMRAQAAEIQQRLRNHAGRIRNKFSNIQRPRLGRKDRLKKEAPGERPRFKLPEMRAPKISLPDKTKFKLPEKAKFHLPESSKFHLPDRSKFHLPEGAKLSNIAEKAKLRLPEKGKFHLPERAKLSNIAERARSHLPERGKFHFPEKAKFHLPDKSKFHFPEKAKFALPSRPKLELPAMKRSAATAEQSTKSRFDLKSYPKLFTKHSKEYTTSSPKQTRGRTPPPRMQQQDVGQGKNWPTKLEEMRYADDEAEEGMRETDSRKSESLFEKDIGYLEDLEKVPTLSTKSSTSRLSEMSEERKKGVLEEINADEFFLRQKGISQDDIDMGQYLSREIREAFRDAEMNALARMGYAEDENVDPRRYQPEPKRPKREVKKKSILKKSETSLSDDGYKTYPPRRPGRKSRSQSKSLLNEDAGDLDASRYDNDEMNLSRYDNVEDEDEELSEYYKSPGPAREYQHYKVPRSHAPVCPSPPVKRKSSLEDEGSHKRMHEGWGEGEGEEEEEEELEVREPPKPMARRKKGKKKQQAEMEEQESVVEELEICEEQMPRQMLAEAEVVPEMESPVPPKRTRTRSSGSRSLRSLATESDVNRSFHSEPGRDRLEMVEDEIVAEESLDSGFAPPRPHVYEVTDLDDPGFGYATIGKPTPKPERPPPPRRRKEISVPVYNTYPRRAPVRPLRNYSTLGPTRPPRQKKVPPIERALAERQSRTYAEIKTRSQDPIDLIEVSGSAKDLQTEKVIEKMKGRPLPPPPRPPRQKSKGPEEDLEPTEEEKLSLSILRDDEFPLERKVAAFVHEPPFERDAVEETCTATQTDPLPEDFSFGTEDNSDVMPEFSHEQLRIQQAFLEEMKKEEEELRRRAGDENDLVDAELKAEVIRQIEDIIAEEKRIMERKRKEPEQSQETEPPKPKSYLDVDADMGYASLERRGHRQEPAARPSQELPAKLDKLQVKELEVETLNVHEVQSDQIFVKELQGNRIASPDIDNRGGTVALGSVDIPPSVIDQIVAKIPWDSLRHTQEISSQQDNLPVPPIRPQRRQRGSQAQDDSDEELFQPRKTHRRAQKQSTDEDERRSSRRLEDRRQGRASDSSGIPELSLQLVRACTSAGVVALRSFAQTNAAVLSSLDRELCVQAVLCIAVALIAGFFLFGFDAKIVHTHRWDFHFPPQPPNAGL